MIRPDGKIDSATVRESAATIILSHLQPPAYSGGSWTINPSATADELAGTGHLVSDEVALKLAKFTKVRELVIEEFQWLQESPDHSIEAEALLRHLLEALS